MAAGKGLNGPSIIIKRVEASSDGGHHGGAWKVAYADFVTAMMAFFLLMWLLNATTEEQKTGLADYFAPTVIQTPPAAAVTGPRTASVTRLRRRCPTATVPATSRRSPAPSRTA